jgi:membrane-bound lytic murein transglycosylase B
MESTYDRAVLGIKLNPRIEELNEKQPEFVRPIWEYLASIVSEARIAKGKGLIGANAALFARLQDTLRRADGSTDRDLGHRDGLRAERGHLQPIRSACDSCL